MYPIRLWHVLWALWFPEDWGSNMYFWPYIDYHRGILAVNYKRPSHTNPTAKATLRSWQRTNKSKIFDTDTRARARVSNSLSPTALHHHSRRRLRRPYRRRPIRPPACPAPYPACRPRPSPAPPHPAPHRRCLPRRRPPPSPPSPLALAAPSSIVGCPRISSSMDAHTVPSASDKVCFIFLPPILLLFFYNLSDCAVLDS